MEQKMFCFQCEQTAGCFEFEWAFQILREFGNNSHKEVKKHQCLY